MAFYHPASNCFTCIVRYTIFDIMISTKPKWPYLSILDRFDNIYKKNYYFLLKLEFSNNCSIFVKSRDEPIYLINNESKE